MSTENTEEAVTASGEETGNLPATQDEAGLPADYDEFSEEDEAGEGSDFFRMQAGEQFQMSAGSETLDVAALVRAQAIYITQQTHFLRHGSMSASHPDYVKLLAEYSLAQGDYISAMQNVLHQLGII